MGVKQQVARPLGQGFPPDFPERLARFRETAGLSWRALARLLGVTTYRLSLWRRGTVPSGEHLFLLLTLAEGMGLCDGILMRPDRDLPHASAPAPTAAHRRPVLQLVDDLFDPVERTR